jgi:hypothetical protein
VSVANLRCGASGSLQIRRTLAYRATRAADWRLPATGVPRVVQARPLVCRLASLVVRTAAPRGPTTYLRREEHVLERLAVASDHRDVDTVHARYVDAGCEFTVFQGAPNRDPSCECQRMDRENEYSAAQLIVLGSNRCRESDGQCLLSRVSAEDSRIRFAPAYLTCSDIALDVPPCRFVYVD